MRYLPKILFYIVRVDRLLFATARSFFTLRMSVAASTAFGAVTTAAAIFLLLDEATNAEEHDNSKDCNHNNITNAHESDLLL